MKCQAQYKEKNKENIHVGEVFSKLIYIQKKNKNKKVKKLEQEDSNKVTLNPNHGAPWGSRGSKILFLFALTKGLTQETIYFVFQPSYGGILTIANSFTIKFLFPFPNNTAPAQGRRKDR